MIRRAALILLSLGASLFARQEASSKPLRVLFIGNSYTYYNNLPRLLEVVAESQKGGPRIETGASLSGGKNLMWHWEKGEALELIRKGGWDFVVLQEHSTLGKVPAQGAEPEINDPATYFEYAAKFHEEIVKAGARTVLYASWARSGFPEHQRRLDDAFIRFALKSGAGIVPAGLAWTVARIEVPAIVLHSPDRSHPTMAGSYLNALVFYQSLTGRRASDPPSVISGPKQPGDARQVTLVNLPWSDANALNQIAQRVVAQEPLRPVR
ncbi:MAG: hypothetical protein HY821_11260 [Acidobacteria bacterium]|nr:hypothetical protein [Acidobacteriota bacterium]